MDACELKPAGAIILRFGGPDRYFFFPFAAGFRPPASWRAFWLPSFGLRLVLAVVAFGAGFGLRLGLRLRTLGRLGAFGQDFRDADQHEVLPVAALAPRILAAALLEGDDLGAADMVEDLGRDARARDHRRADLRRVAAQHDDVAELHDGARLALDALDLEDLVLDDPVLLAAGFDDCEHRFFPRSIPALGRSGPAFSSRFVLWLQALSAVTIRADRKARANGRTYGGQGQNCQESRESGPDAGDRRRALTGCPSIR